MNELPRWQTYLLTTLPRPAAVTIIMVAQLAQRGQVQLIRFVEAHLNYIAGMIFFIPPVFIALARSYAADNLAEMFALYFMSILKWATFCSVTLICILIPCAVVMGLSRAVDYYRHVDTTLPKREKKESDE